MKKQLRWTITQTLAACVLCFAALTVYSKGSKDLQKGSVKKPKAAFPYAKAGLTKRQAAAHLLSRFTYGLKPGQIDEVASMGLEQWFAQQLGAGLADDSLNSRLKEYDELQMNNTEIVNTFPKNPQVRGMAIRDSFISKDSVDVGDKKALNAQLKLYREKMGIRDEGDLYRDLISQNILRAAYSNNQLQEVMSDFWFNHFNVSLAKPDDAQYILSYERDVIRPNALGNFGSLLLATAKSPAMLYFLDNFSSTGPEIASANNNKKVNKKGGGNKKDKAPASKKEFGPQPDMITDEGATMPLKDSMAPMDMMNTTAAAPKKDAAKKAVKGLNENYAREVMELHTLGVDGGYTQKDVTEAARVLTGWSVYPMSKYGNQPKQQVRFSEDSAKKPGFVHDGDFIFDPRRHDMGEKTVLKEHFAANGGYEEGVDLLNMLAHNPATAKFICRKLAVHFVSDNPPKSLVDKMAATFLKTDGNIADVLTAMVNAPEFWASTVVHAKTKSPFELAISAVRALNVDVVHPYELFNQVNKMGEKIFYYLAPTGFPDKGQYWISTGALLNRMNFGLAFAYGRIRGIKPDLLALNNGHEPESAAAALTTYSKIMMPERNLSATIKRLTPLLNDPELAKKVNDAANASEPVKENNRDLNKSMHANENAPNPLAGNKDNTPVKKSDDDNMLAQVVGIIIGSPEFQKR